MREIKLIHHFWHLGIKPTLVSNALHSVEYSKRLPFSTIEPAAMSNPTAHRDALPDPHGSLSATLSPLAILRCQRSYSTILRRYIAAVQTGGRTWYGDSRRYLRFLIARFRLKFQRSPPTAKIKIRELFTYYIESSFLEIFNREFFQSYGIHTHCTHSITAYTPRAD